MKPAANRGFGSKAVLGANFVSTSPNVPSSKLPSSSRLLDSVPFAVSGSSRPPLVPPQVPQLKPFTDLSQDIDVPDVMPWYNGETANDYTMHLLALSGSDAFVADSDHLFDAKKHDAQKSSKLSKLKGAVLASSFLNAASAGAKKTILRAENPKALASFKTLSALSEEEKMLYPSWMTEGDIQTRKFLAQKIVANRNRLRGLLIRADEMLGTDDLRETLAKKYGLNEATYTEVADMVSNNRTKVNGVFDDIHALTQEQQSVLQEVQRALASTTTDLNFEISNLEDRLDDLQEDSLLQDAERSLGHAKSMRIKLSTSHSRFLDQAVERLTTKMPQLVKTKHMEQDLVLAADSLETMRKTVHECKASTSKAQKEAQEKNDALKLCQKELSEVSKERDRLIKSEKDLRLNVDSWREKFYQSDRELAMEVRRGEEAERQHTAILEITLRNAQKVVEDRITATARAHEDQVRKLNTIMFQLEQDLMYEKRLRDPGAVLKNADNLSTQNNAAKPASIFQQLEDSQSENEALQKTVDRLISEVNSASDEKESLEKDISALKIQIKSNVDQIDSLSTENKSKLSQMQVRLDSMASIIDVSNAKIEGYESAKDDHQNLLSQAHQQISILKKSQIDSVKQGTRSSHSVATQTFVTVETTVDLPTKTETTSKPEFEKSMTAEKVDFSNNPPCDLASIDVKAFVAKPLAVTKVLCGTQTDVPYPQIGHDVARLVIDCTRPECIAKIKEVHQLQERVISNANAEAQDSASRLANQLAIRDREHKGVLQKLRKEMDIKLTFEKDSFLKARNQLEQFKGAVKKKVEATIMEIKKMKRIGDFSNVGEIELHLNDVYIGATESFDSFQAEIEARNQEASQSIVNEDSASDEMQHDKIDDDSQLIGSSKPEANILIKKNSKLGAASKAIMFTQAASKAFSANGGGSGASCGSDGTVQMVSIDDLKITAERFIYSTQQFVSGCSFGVNSSYVSLERAQKKLSFCVEHFRVQKKAAADCIFQLNLDLKDFKQKYEDCQMVMQSQQNALAKAQRVREILAQRLSKHEDVEPSDFDDGHVDASLHLPAESAQKSLKSLAINAKLSSATKTACLVKNSGISSNTNTISKSHSKSSAKLAGNGSGSSHRTGSSTEYEDSEGLTSVAESFDPASTRQLSDPNDNIQTDFPLQSEETKRVDSSKSGEKDLNSAAIDTSPKDTDAKHAAELYKRKGTRRHLEELKLSTVSCIYQESSISLPSLDFATQVELGSLRSAHISHEAKIRKLEQLLEDKQDQLQHFSVLMETSSRDHARCRNHAVDLSLEVHSERSKLETQQEWNAELLQKNIMLEEKLRIESQSLVAVRMQESIHLKKLDNLTHKMHTFYQRCEQYVQEERAPLLALLFEFWIRLGLLRKDIGMIFSLDSADVCSFRSSATDITKYSTQDNVASFTEILEKKSLLQLQNEMIQKFGHCCSDIALLLNSHHIRQRPVLEKHAETKSVSPVTQSSPNNTTLSHVSKDFKQTSSPPVAPQFAHKQLFPSIAPKMKFQSFESISLDDALHRSSDDIVEKLTSKLIKSSTQQDSDVSKKLLHSWTKMTPGSLQPEKMLLTTPGMFQPSPTEALVRPWRTSILSSIQEEI